MPQSKLAARVNGAVGPFATSSSLVRNLVSLGSLLLVAACSKGDGAAQKGAPAMPPPQVSIVTVAAKDAPITFEYTGQTAGSRETEVRARVAGILQRRLFEEGSNVKAGTALFQIDPANLQTQSSSADAAVAVAEARLNQARRDSARLAPLIAERAISQKEFDDSKSAVESAEASVKQARAQAAEAKLNLGYTKVLAPIGGITGSAAKADGSLVSSADMLTTIVQVNPIYVNFSVSEGDLLKLNRQLASGQVAVPGKRGNSGSADFAVTVKLSDGSTFPRQGKMNFSSEKLNAQTGSYDARAEISNADGALRPGQFVRVILAGANRTQSITVPQRAILDGPMGKMVFKVTPENTLAPQPVDVDGWSNGEWIVTKGLASGDRVMTDGFIKANQPGMKVTPVPFVANAAGAAGGAGAPAAASAPGATKSAGMPDAAKDGKQPPAAAPAATETPKPAAPATQKQ
jgi:membrane fusion protein, multidrug efflux system